MQRWESVCSGVLGICLLVNENQSVNVHKFKVSKISNLKVPTLQRSNISKFQKLKFQHGKMCGTHLSNIFNNCKSQVSKHIIFENVFGFVLDCLECPSVSKDKSYRFWGSRTRSKEKDLTHSLHSETIFWVCLLAPFMGGSHIMSSCHCFVCVCFERPIENPEKTESQTCSSCL